METAADRPLLRIGELSRRVGISDHLLRAWESRYGLLQPVRSPGGFRLYSEADESRVRTMQAYLAGGLSAAEAARATLGGGGGAALDGRTGPPAAGPLLGKSTDSVPGEVASGTMPFLSSAGAMPGAVVTAVAPLLRCTAAAACALAG